MSQRVGPVSSRAYGLGARLATLLWFGAFSLAAVIALAPAVAYGETPQEHEAREKFDEGLDLSEAGKWAEALEAFRASDALNPVASVRLNIAATLRSLGRYVESKRTAEGILANAEELKLKPKLRPEVEKLIAEVSEKIVWVRLAVTPVEATVEVDGEPIVPNEQGRVEIDPGRHVFVVRAEGHETATVSREIAAGDARIELEAPRFPPALPPEPEPEPLYAQWWLWTAVGGAVVVTVAAVAGAVVATRPEDSPLAEPPSSTIGHVIPVAFRF